MTRIVGTIRFLDLMTSLLGENMVYTM